MSMPLTHAAEEISKWRQSERSQMIGAIRDMIEEARRMSRSQRTPARERLRWTRLAGQLIWYKDSILKSLTLEALEKEVDALREMVEARNKPSQGPIPRRTILSAAPRAAGDNRKPGHPREHPTLARRNHSSK